MSYMPVDRRHTIVTGIKRLLRALGGHKYKRIRLSNYLCSTSAGRFNTGSTTGDSLTASGPLIVSLLYSKVLVGHLGGVDVYLLNITADYLDIRA